MRAITLTQPYATLVAIGAKRLETRSWRTSYRGPLAIHAAATFGKGGRRGYFSRCQYDPFKAALEPHLRVYDRYNCFAAPMGAIIAVCELRDVRIIGDGPCGDPTIAADDMLTLTPILGDERAFGDYAAGRYAWLLANVRALPEPIPAKGALSLWEWEG